MKIKIGLLIGADGEFFPCPIKEGHDLMRALNEYSAWDFVEAHPMHMAEVEVDIPLPHPIDVDGKVTKLEKVDE